MFERLGRFIYRQRKRMFALFLILLFIFGGVGSLLFSRLSNGGYTDPSSPSATANAYLNNTFHTKDPAIVLIADAGKSVSDPTLVVRGETLENSLHKYPDVSKTLSYWSSGGAKALLSKDGNASYIFVYTKESDPSTSTSLAKVIEATYTGSLDGFKVYVEGISAINYSVSTKIKKDLGVAESISIPMTFALLVVVFGGLVASSMPLVVGFLSILGAFFILYLISLFTGVSIFALNLVTGIGLGLGIDYALLIVNRFREELHKGHSVEDSIVTTVRTAGRTVLFSGFTVIVTLASLMFFPLMFLKSFGYAGVSVVSMAVFGAIIPLPAILAMLGDRVDKFTIRKSATKSKEDGGWARTARFVMRRPVGVVLAAVAILGFFAIPLKDIAFTQTDVRVLPASNPAAVASAVGLSRFPGQDGSPISVVVPNSAGKADAITSYAQSLVKVPGIAHFGGTTTVGNVTKFTLIESVEPRTPQGQALINALRKIPAPAGTVIGGVAADYTDSQAGIAQTLPWVLGWVCFGTLILLFLFTGSILLPIKAVILNFLSLSASLGAVTWIFIDGHATWLVGKFTNTGALDTAMVILISVVTFGLSMDYEVFLISRIKEEHDNGYSNVDSVARGLQRSARIITAAALLLAVVFAVFITSGVSSIKMLGFGVALAIVLDASIVRALLVPALMRLFGSANWWAPSRLKRFVINH